ncbi:MAG TPA: Lrp/AsnC family transcriptional regulator [Steroidobacteraceae bacterium]|nr:Lrp/AsnC family transcriptional regulator [Steroidobacteraceae bacterium]
MNVIDKIDRQILGLLQQDASLPIQQVADQVGLSVNPCWRRIRRMEAEGVIQGRVALVDPAKVGLGLTVYVRVKTREHSAAWAKKLNEVIAAMPEIQECHRIGGDVDYLLKVVVPDMAGYDRSYKELIERLPALSDVSALFSMERLKSTTGLPIPDET